MTYGWMRTEYGVIRDRTDKGLGKALIETFYRLENAERYIREHEDRDHLSIKQRTVSYSDWEEVS